jgi:hypothetical protein
MTLTTDTELLAALHVLLNQVIDLTPEKRDAWFARLALSSLRTRPNWKRSWPRNPVLMHKDSSPAAHSRSRPRRPVW